MVDIHSHILPMVDDGARSWEIAIEMVQMAQQDGVTHMVATPHANYEFIYDRQSHTALLAELQAKVGDGIHLLLGCDFHLSYENIEDAVAHPQRYTIGDTRYLLVELSDYSEARAVVAKSFGKEIAEAVFEKNPRAIIENRALSEV